MRVCYQRGYPVKVSSYHVHICTYNSALNMFYIKVHLYLICGLVCVLQGACGQPRLSNCLLDNKALETFHMVFGGMFWLSSVFAFVNLKFWGCSPDMEFVTDARTLSV